MKPIVIKEHPPGLPPMTWTVQFTSNPTPVQVAAGRLFYKHLFERAMATK